LLALTAPPPSATAARLQPPAIPTVPRIVADAAVAAAVLNVPANPAIPSDATGRYALGVAGSQVDAEAAPQRRATAHSAPLAAPPPTSANPATDGQPHADPPATALVQTAEPDHVQPAAQSFGTPTSPSAALLHVQSATGQAQARWDPTRGPCVDPLSDASTTLTNLAAVATIPSLPSTSDLTGSLTPTADDRTRAAATAAAKALRLPLTRLGGLLDGADAATPTGAALLTLPGTVHTRSTVQLIGQATKAVQSRAQTELGDLQLLGGTIAVHVTAQPVLAATATGDPASSTAGYQQPPAVQISSAGRPAVGLGGAGQPTAATVALLVPIGVPDGSAQPTVGEAIPDGDPAPATAGGLEVAALRISVGHVESRRDGAAVGATAAAITVRLLATSALPLSGLPPVLAEIALGEQAVRAVAPNGGIACPSMGPPAIAAGPAAPPPALGRSRPLAYTTAAYLSVPLGVTGAAMLLAGLILIVVAPAVGRHRPVGGRHTGRHRPG
jgi:hypothetical protein